MNVDDSAILSQPEPSQPRHSLPDGALLVTIEAGARALGIGRTKLYELLANGALTSVKIGRRRLVHVSELQRFASELPTARPAAPKDV